jgi:hypothetical protein
MASKKNIKKDIRFLVEQVINDALELGVVIEKEEDKKSVLEVIVDLVDLHNDLISRVNNPDGKDDPKLVKQHYNKIYDDLLKKSSEAYDKLNGLTN